MCVFIQSFFHILVSSRGRLMNSWIAWSKGSHFLIDVFKAEIQLQEKKTKQNMEQIIKPVRP